MNQKEVIIATLILLSITLNFTHLYLSMVFLEQPKMSILIVLLGVNLIVLFLLYQGNKIQIDSHLFAMAVVTGIQLWLATAFYIANIFLSSVNFSYTGVIIALFLGAFLSNIILLIIYIKEKNTV